MAEEPDRAPHGDEDHGTGARERLGRWWRRSRSRAVEVGERLPFSGIVAGIYERDRHAAGTLLGSALALRLFLFFVPTVLLLFGIAGILGRYSTVDSSSELGIGGALGHEIDTAFDQDRLSPWIALIAGIVGMAAAGRSLSRALVVSSALSWQMGGNQPLRMRVVGVVVGILIGLSSTWVLVNEIRQTAGIAITSVSFVGVAGVYLVLWSMLYLALPRATNDPGAALPGAAVISAVMTGLQVVTQLYLPQKISGASSMYGTFGAVVAVLGWFFVVGRVLAFTFALNAVLFEDVGSISRFVFALPVLRAIPRRSEAFARYFDLPRPS
jgi:membrane protein